MEKRIAERTIGVNDLIKQKSSSAIPEILSEQARVIVFSSLINHHHEDYEKSIFFLLLLPIACFAFKNNSPRKRSKVTIKLLLVSYRSIMQRIDYPNRSTSEITVNRFFFDPIKECFLNTSTRLALDQCHQSHRSSFLTSLYPLTDDFERNRSRRDVKPINRLHLDITILEILINHWSRKKMEIFYQTLRKLHVARYPLRQFKETRVIKSRLPRGY